MRESAKKSRDLHIFPALVVAIDPSTTMSGEGARSGSGPHLDPDRNAVVNSIFYELSMESDLSRSQNAPENGPSHESPALLTPFTEEDTSDTLLERRDLHSSINYCQQDSQTTGTQHQEPSQQSRQEQQGSTSRSALVGAAPSAGSPLTWVASQGATPQFSNLESDSQGEEAHESTAVHDPGSHESIAMPVTDVAGKMKTTKFAKMKFLAGWNLYLPAETADALAECEYYIEGKILTCPRKNDPFYSAKLSEQDIAARPSALQQHHINNVLNIPRTKKDDLAAATQRYKDTTVPPASSICATPTQDSDAADRLQARRAAAASPEADPR